MSDRITPEQVERGGPRLIGYDDARANSSTVPIWWLRRLAAQMRGDATELTRLRPLAAEAEVAEAIAHAVHANALALVEAARVWRKSAQSAPLLQISRGLAKDPEATP